MTARSASGSSGVPSTKTWIVIVPKAPGSAAQMRPARSCSRGRAHGHALADLAGAHLDASAGDGAHAPAVAVGQHVDGVLAAAGQGLDHHVAELGPAQGGGEVVGVAHDADADAGAAEAGLGDERERPGGGVGQHRLGGRLPHGREAVVDEPVVGELLVGRDVDDTAARQRDRRADGGEPVAAAHPRRHLGVDGRHEEVDAVLLADVEQGRHERRVVEAGHDDALVGLVEGARVPGGVGGDDPPVEAERRERPAEAAQQLDPPAGGRDQDGDGAARSAVGAAVTARPRPGRCRSRGTRGGWRGPRG